MTVQHSILPNGLHVISEAMDHVETTSFGVWFNCGTRDESPDQNGIAHLLEHMMFKGTQRRSARQIAEQIENVGGYSNAYTSREHTAYYARVMAKDLGLAADIIGDCLQNSLFQELELEREKQVIIQEIGQNIDTPDDIVFDHLQKAAYGDQPLGRQILGQAEIIRAITPGQLKDYAARHYAYGNIVISASGKLDHARLVDLAQLHFAALPQHRPGTLSPSGFTPMPVFDVRDSEQAHLALALPACGTYSNEYYKFSVMSNILGGTSSSRLFQEVREKRGLAYSVYSFISSVDDAGILGVYAGTGPESAALLRQVVEDEMKKLSDGCTDEELERAKQQAKSALLMGLEQSFSRAEYWAQSFLTYGRLVPVSEFIGQIDAIGKSDVRAAAEFVLAQKPAIAAVAPQKAIEEWEKFSL